MEAKIADVEYKLKGKEEMCLSTIHELSEVKGSELKNVEEVERLSKLA